MRIIIALALMATTTDALVGLGVDLGTSGVRVCVVERGARGVSILSEGATRWTDDEGREPAVWLRALRETIAKCDDAAVARVGRVAVSGTSASTLLVDGATGADVAAHQADYVAAALCAGVDGEQLAAPPALRSDWHNALKMGFDVVELRWPAWLLEGAMPAVGAAPAALERLGVLRPGVADERRAVSEAAAAHWRLPEGAAVGGTTDSIAAFLACSCDAAAGVVRVEPGRAVTSLGSTTALKLVSDVKIDDAATGVYSHRLDPRGTRIFNPTSISLFDFGTGLDDAWLVGGASNAGCKVLRDFAFGDDELAALSLTLDAARTNDAGIYPLSKTGERFPFNDAAKEPKLPGGDDREAVLHDLLSVQTAGGGAKNPQWRALREAMLGVPVVGAENTDAAFGAALLALREA
ncbi:carbohydrate kinase [Aureococcus anophagefferens]|nr:carbohydrate kinase [Aureococcus anophagefferens]